MEVFKLLIMNHRTRRSFAYLALWGAALSLIVYFNSARSSGVAYAWTTVRYIPQQSDLPRPRGKCPGIEKAVRPALIVAHVEADGNSSWLEPLADRYHFCVYSIDAPQDSRSEYLQVPANRGHEAMAYLTFIIDNYAHIPKDGAVFVHGSRFSWHNDHTEYDNLSLLKSLDTAAALEPYGYHNMRCDWSAGTCGSDVTPQGSLETTLRAYLEPFNTRVVSDRALVRGLRSLFGGGKLSTLDPGDTIRSQCCAQFVVSRESIWQHSREEYIAIRQWLLDPNRRDKDVAPRDDRVTGRILSYLWHILFMRHDALREQSSVDVHGGVSLKRLNALACPRADECYCRLYGRCGLQGCIHPGLCRGQYKLPPGYKLPPDWAARYP